MRECGDCRLCCKLMRITELQKPPNQWCQHACSRGCGIYETRPNECRTFRCMWLDEVLPESLKPNRVKAVMFAYTLPTGITRVTLHEDPDMPGAFDKFPQFMAAAQAVIKKGFEFLVISGSRRRLFSAK